MQTNFKSLIIVGATALTLSMGMVGAPTVAEARGGGHNGGGHGGGGHGGGAHFGGGHGGGHFGGGRRFGGGGRGFGGGYYGGGYRGYRCGPIRLAAAFADATGTEQSLLTMQTRGGRDWRPFFVTKAPILSVFLFRRHV